MPLGAPAVSAAAEGDVVSVVLVMPAGNIALDPDKTYVVYASSCISGVPAAQAIFLDADDNNLSIARNRSLRASVDGNSAHDRLDGSLAGDIVGSAEDLQVRAIVRLEDGFDEDLEEDVYFYTCSYEAAFFQPNQFGLNPNVVTGHIHTGAFAQRDRQVYFNIIGEGAGDFVS